MTAESGFRRPHFGHVRIARPDYIESTLPGRGRDRLFPVRAIERVGGKLVGVDAGQAADIDVDLVRVRTRHVKRVDAAMTAEAVLRDAGVESVLGKVVGASE